MRTPAVLKQALSFAIACVLSVSAAAADLTTAQLQTLKASINANFLTEWNTGQIGAIVAAYNAPASPTFIVWKTSLDAPMYRDAIVWTELTGRSAGERDMFAFLTNNGTASINCSRSNVRQAINDAFSGAGGLNTRTALIAACKRSITRGERLYATGTGTDATPGAVVVEGDITEGNVIEAMGL